jgi:hypothetical protein
MLPAFRAAAFAFKSSWRVALLGYRPAGRSGLPESGEVWLPESGADKLVVVRE